MRGAGRLDQVPFDPAEQWRGVQTLCSTSINGASRARSFFRLAQKITPRAANGRRRPMDWLTELLIPSEEIFGRYAAYDLINETTGEIYVESGDETCGGQ